MIIITILSFLAIEFIPKIPKVGDHLPVPLLVMGSFTIINYFWLETKTVGDFGEVAGGFPTFSLPDVNGWDFSKVLVLLRKALEFSLVGVIESLMTV